MTRKILAAVLAAAAACAPSPPVTAPAPAELRDMPDLLRESGVPGLSIAVVRNGEVAWTGAYGTVNDSARSPLDAETVFEAASMSKPVFAWMVLRLADRGLIDLDRPLAELVGQYPRLAQEPRWRRITARMVLSHSSGLPNWGGDTLQLAFDPGTGYRYSGEGFTLLQKAIERVTGRSLEELARREVFGPLGMKRSSFVWQNRFEGNAAWATNWHWYVAPVSRWAEPNAAYTLITTAGDYARFVAAVLTGRGLSPEMWRRYLTPVRETEPGIAIGLGIRLEAGRWFFHSGSNGRRFTCFMAGDLTTGTGLVFLTSAYDGSTLARPLASRVFGAEPPAKHWDWYERHDDPRRLAIKSVQRSAVEGGADSARGRLEAVQSSEETRLSFDDLLELGAFLVARGETALSIEVLRDVVRASPDSAAAHLALGRAQERAGDTGAALESYHRAEALGEEDARRHIAWSQERLARRNAKVVAPLKSYAGDYGERRVVLREDGLHLGGGAEPDSRLVPIGPELFELERDPGVRIRFEGRPVREVVAISRDGSVDRWPRSN